MTFNTSEIPFSTKVYKMGVQQPTNSTFARKNRPTRHSPERTGRQWENSVQTSDTMAEKGFSHTLTEHVFLLAPYA